MFDFSEFNLFINLAIFAAAAVVVWLAGTRVTSYVNAISSKTGIGHAVIGMILLAGITSLPEIGVTVTSAASGAAALAVNNLFGSIAVQVAILALIDFLIGRKALTSELPDATVILQGALNVLLLTIATAGMVVGDFPIIGIGAWAWLSLFGYLGCVWVLAQSRGRGAWLAARDGEIDDRVQVQQDEAQEEADKELKDQGLNQLIWKTAGLAIAILAAGYLLSRTGDALAQQTGLGGSYVGFVLLAFATSLPELSSTIAAARSRLYTLAISDILGTNLINVGLLFLVDAAAPGDPVLGQVDTFAVFGALVGIALTALFIIGMAERRDKTVTRMGIDSLAVLFVYAVSLVILYFLR
ncbi:sodium:calcium antiporter [Devosia nitrariae]|uniref:Sodium/calcium exchanger membrane region domain-containing protein n=1 Tax=Devosia nitrariae TaxID=2071872 RepID=A0ABQ5W6W2_9HYPH|nr:sodium:calcium antiporter [Devosia nitrariae]GLQ55345.1 hypothetical protein GCM10010862_26040 [Devosia nitrariae]